MSIGLGGKSKKYLGQNNKEKEKQEKRLNRISGEGGGRKKEKKIRLG